MLSLQSNLRITEEVDELLHDFKSRLEYLFHTNTKAADTYNFLKGKSKLMRIALLVSLSLDFERTDEFKGLKSTGNSIQPTLFTVHNLDDLLNTLIRYRYHSIEVDWNNNIEKSKIINFEILKGIQYLMEANHLEEWLSYGSERVEKKIEKIDVHVGNTDNETNFYLNILENNNNQKTQVLLTGNNLLSVKNTLFFILNNLNESISDLNLPYHFVYFTNTDIANGSSSLTNYLTIKENNIVYLNKGQKLPFNPFINLKKLFGNSLTQDIFNTYVKLFVECICDHDPSISPVNKNLLYEIILQTYNECNHEKESLNFKKIYDKYQTFDSESNLLHILKDFVDNDYFDTSVEENSVLDHSLVALYIKEDNLKVYNVISRLTILYLYYLKQNYAETEYFFCLDNSEENDINFVFANEFNKSIHSIFTAEKLTNTSELNCFDVIFIHNQETETEGQLISRNLDLNKLEYLELSNSIESLSYNEYILYKTINKERIKLSTEYVFTNAELNWFSVRNVSYNLVKAYKTNLLFDDYSNITFLSLKLNHFFSPEEMKFMFGEDIDLELDYNLYFNNELIAQFKKYSQQYSSTSFREILRIDRFEDINLEARAIDGSVAFKALIDLPVIKEISFWNREKNNYLRLVSDSNRTKFGYVIVLKNNSTAEYEDSELHHLLGNECVILSKEDYENENINDIENSSKQYFQISTNQNFKSIFLESNHTIVSNNLIGLRIKDLIKDRYLTSTDYKLSIKGNEVWQSIELDTILPLGVITLKVITADYSEVFVLYNIGSVQLDYIYDLNNPKINVLNIDPSMELEAYGNNEYTIEQNKNEISFIRKSNNLTKLDVKLRFIYNNQNSGLIVKVLSPFSGEYLINDKNDIVTHNSKLLYKDLFKYRFKLNNDKDYRITISNTKIDEDLKFIEYVKKQRIFDIQLLRDYIQKFFSLSSVFDKDNFVTVSLYNDQDQQKIFSFDIHRFDYDSLDRVIKEVEDNNKQLLWEVLQLYPESTIVPVQCKKGAIDYLEINSSEDIENLIDSKINNVIVLNKYSKTPLRIDLLQNKFLYSLEDINGKLIASSLDEFDFDSDIWDELLNDLYIVEDLNVSYECFDVFRIIAKRPDLVAKMFVYLLNNEKLNLINIEKFELDLGISLHWISNKIWYETINDIIQDNEQLKQQIISYLSFNNYINSKDNNFHFNTEFTNFKERLGDNVRNLLPFIDLNGDISNQVKIDFFSLFDAFKIENNSANKIIYIAIIISYLKTKDHDMWSNFSDQQLRKINYSMLLDENFCLKTLNYITNK